ncbi:isoprenoid synthase domain-containing protein [Zopfochytrium polystomum]|nr:isoprenoid synthase domain-containing protein [Zopfochytrium polystomum]
MGRESSSTAAALVASIGRPSEIVAMLKYKLLVSDNVTKYVSLDAVPLVPVAETTATTNTATAATTATTATTKTSKTTTSTLRARKSATAAAAAAGNGAPPSLEPGLKYDSHALCYYLLNLTSRSFARVIQELHPKLSLPVCIFYLVLRGLDTVEDDVHLPLDVKLPTLTRFHEHIQQPGWTFTRSSPTEKDRFLLEQFDAVIDQFLRLDKPYRDVITDITRRMGAGMAEFCEPGRSVESMDDYNLYTHYVAGLVGLGLTGLFVATGLESHPLLQVAPQRGSRAFDLPNNMGTFLQKANIVKDFFEDLDDGRRFWPSAVWRKFVRPDEDAAALARPDRRDDALACLNALCVDALRLVPDCLEFMSLLTDPSVLTFCAIPQTMAIASFALFFNNPVVFAKRGLKIRRGHAVDLIQRCKMGFAEVKVVYLEFALEMARRNAERVKEGNEKDDSFWEMATVCADIARWIHAHDLRTANGVLVTRPRRAGPHRSLAGHAESAANAAIIVVVLLALLAAVVAAVAAAAWAVASVVGAGAGPGQHVGWTVPPAVGEAWVWVGEWARGGGVAARSG